MCSINFTDILLVVNMCRVVSCCAVLCCDVMCCAVLLLFDADCLFLVLQAVYMSISYDAGCLSVMLQAVDLLCCRLSIFFAILQAVYEFFS
jgi:hypothetical protein